MEWDHTQAPSPRESMHSILLLHTERHDIELKNRIANPHFEIAAWLKLKNTTQLPALLLFEYQDLNGSRWQIVDSARINTLKSIILLSGIVDLNVRKLMCFDLYLCHSNPNIICDVEELRLNNRLMRRDFLETYNVA